MFAALFTGMEALVVWAIFIGWIVYKVCQAANAAQERQKEENLKYTNPEAYAKLKQMEHERQMMAHDEKRMQHDKFQTGAGIFGAIVRNIWK